MIEMLRNDLPSISHFDSTTDYEMTQPMLLQESVEFIELLSELETIQTAQKAMPLQIESNIG